MIDLAAATAEWLAAGNKITICPPAFADFCSAILAPAHRLAIAQHTESLWMAEHGLKAPPARAMRISAATRANKRKAA